MPLRSVALGGTAAALIALALFQAREIRRGGAGDSPPVPLLPGETFRVAFIDAGGNAIAAPEAGCWAAFVIDPNCPACRELGRRFRQGGLENGRSVYWILAGRDVEVGEFVDEHGIPAARFLRPERPEGHALAILRRLGIFATPTRVVFDGNTVRDVDTSRAVPDSTELRHYCSGGAAGPAP